ncbi:MAG TPA: LuxR C-terminal-related transcriptional regulator [Actinomycetes bacterium]|nr:LuxR C-terminal-related transcriptional regulator [Actinomycetes bacterium]
MAASIRIVDTNSGKSRGARGAPARQLSDERPTDELGMALLATKLTPPHSSLGQVSRSRLLDLLQAGAQRLLTLVSAPAGAGKTTLLAFWSSSRRPPGPVAWLSLDAGDNHPARFWAYVLAALCQSDAVPGDSALGGLSAQPGSDEQFLRQLVSGLAELPTPVVLVLDDLHDITDAKVLAGLEFLLRHAPPQLRLVLATRSDPPLPLQRLLVSGQLAQVRAADLAFTVAEVAELLAACDDPLHLSEDDLALLQARTEGWAAGLRLAALSLETQPDPHRFVAELAGDDKSIADYLTGEVLDRQPEELRSFLLQTCIVDELNGDLADTLTGGHGGESMLASLERTNGFVTPVGSRRTTYRYHQLFAELLRYELRREAPGQVVKLHRRAAYWYAARRLTVHAIEHALMAKDWRYAADLMAKHGSSLILRGDAVALHRLVGRLPDDLVQMDPELVLLGAADRIVRGDPDEAAAHLRTASQRAQLLGEQRQGQVALLLAIVNTALAWQVGDLDRVLVAGEEALALQSRVGADDEDDAARAILLSNVGAAALWAGHLDRAELHLHEGLAVAVGAGLASQQSACMSQLALVYAMRGELHEALRWGTNAAEIAVEQDWLSSSTPAAGGDLALAWVSYYQDDLGEASRYADQAGAASGGAWQPMTLAVAILRARLLRARGDIAGSLSTVAAVRRDLAGWRAPLHLWRWLLLTEAELRSAAGHPQSASAVRTSLDSGPVSGGEAVVLARLHLAESDPAGAAETIAPCLDGVASDGFLLVPAEVWLLDALASDAVADHDRAASSLERALSLAEHEGLRRSFLDAGAPGRSLLARYRQRVPTSWSYLDELLQASAEGVQVTVPEARLLEHLTERELAVLNYLPSLMTYEEIAGDLFVSLNTVKTHAYGIFRKLGVTGRRQAVRSARELHLL